MSQLLLAFPPKVLQGNSNKNVLKDHYHWASIWNICRIVKLNCQKIRLFTSFWIFSLHACSSWMCLCMSLTTRTSADWFPLIILCKCIWYERALKRTFSRSMTNRQCWRNMGLILFKLPLTVISVWLAMLKKSYFLRWWVTIWVFPAM